MKKNYPCLLIVIVFCYSFPLLAQPGQTTVQTDSVSVASVSRAQKEGVFSGFVVSGDLQSDMLLAETDTAIGAFKGANPFKSNSYLRIALNNQYFSVGVRGEYMKNPLPGFDADFKGAGIAHLFLRGKYKGIDLTAGDFYDQFGNGLIFRTYEERSLGIDNSLRGGRLIFQPVAGVTLKLLGGSQRYYFKERNNTVYGADAEIDLSEQIEALSLNGWRLSAGASFVTKSEPDEMIMMSDTTRLNLPRGVPAASGRINVQRGGFVVLAEYAHKWNDPGFDNNYIYKNGNVVLLSASYSRRGLSLLAQTKRNENMSYRSVRSRSGTASFINHLPPFSMTHSYSLAAKYPYATQRLGEWAFQTEARYNFKRKTPLGGRYGTDVRLFVSHIRGLFDPEKNRLNEKGEIGYRPRFFEMSKEIYYNDFNLEVSKKVTSSFSFTAMYANLVYNQKIVEGHGNNGDLVCANIFIYDGKYKLAKSVSVRSELQYLHTKQDEGDWMYAMIEWSLYSKIMVGVADMYNAGTTKLHYPMATVALSHKAHRLQLGYGRTREGISCAGGVCRLVPASKGLTISYNFNF